MSDELKPQSVGDDPEFRRLVEFWAGKYHSALAPVRKGHEEAFAALIVHVNAWGARLAGVPEGWKLVPIEPTEDMVTQGFESWPDPFFSKPEEWAAYEEMTGCQKVAYRAKLCWLAMLAAAPPPDKEDV